MVLPWRRGGRVGHRRDLFLTPLNEGFFIWDYEGFSVQVSGFSLYLFFILTPDTSNPEIGAQTVLFFSAFLFQEIKLDTTLNLTPRKSYEKTLDIFTSLPIM